MDNFKVYVHTTPDGKRYVGITKQNVEKRWSKGKGYKRQTFNKAIEKYGWENILHEIIAENLTEEDACVLEMNLIKEYNLTDKDYGYNVSVGLDKPKGTKGKSFWLNFLGKNMYIDVLNYCKPRKLSVATFVRLAIESYLKQYCR